MSPTGPTILFNDLALYCFADPAAGTLLGTLSVAEDFIWPHFRCGSATHISVAIQVFADQNSPSVNGRVKVRGSTLLGVLDHLLNLIVGI